MPLCASPCLTEKGAPRPPGGRQWVTQPQGWTRPFPALPRVSKEVLWAYMLLVDSCRWQKPASLGSRGARALPWEPVRGERQRPSLMAQSNESTPWPPGSPSLLGGTASALTELW